MAIPLDNGESEWVLFNYRALYIILPIEGARVTRSQGGYFPDHIWRKPQCSLSIYLIDPRAGQWRANTRHLLTVYHSIF
jgi:hypothetical protein